MIADGSRPVSAVNNWPVSLRRITPNPLTIPNDGNAGNVNLAVSSDPGPWNWSGYSDGLVFSVLTASNTLNSATLPISWETGALVTDESGEGSLEIVPSDSDIPYAVVGLSTTVVEVSCCATVGDFNHDGRVDVSDVVAWVGWSFNSNPTAPACEYPQGFYPECDMDASGQVDVADIVYWVNWSFDGGPDPEPCP